MSNNKNHPGFIRSEGIKNCPCCGSEAALWHWGKMGRAIKCPACCLKVEQKVVTKTLDWLEAELIKDWNLRTENKKTS